MPDTPTYGQISILSLAALSFASGLVLSFFSGTRRFPNALSLLGLILGALTLGWHSYARGKWWPLEDNFDALIWLSLILAVFAMYLQRRRLLGHIDWFILPVVIVLLVGAGVFGSARPHQYTGTLWAWTHRISVYTSPIAFALAAAAGVMYLIADRRLRSKTMPMDAGFGNLEKIERMNYLSVSLGFALLTVGLATGLVRAMGSQTRLGPEWFLSPKVLLAFSAYAVYALVLHSPINPRFRGRWTAVLSICGFVLMLGTLIVVQRL